LQDFELNGEENILNNLDPNIIASIQPILDLLKLKYGQDVIGLYEETLAILKKIQRILELHLQDNTEASES